MTALNTALTATGSSTTGTHSTLTGGFATTSSGQLWLQFNTEIDTSFFMTLLNADIPRICIENPLPSKMSGLPKYTQIIQPYQFGHDHSKKTCLWLKNLPLLQQTKIIEYTYITTPNGVRYTKGWYETPRNSIARSRTFQGIADAMAAQWSKVLVEEVIA